MTTSTANLSPAVVLEQQKRRHATLLERRTRAQGTLDAERRALDEARQESEALFGTSDLTELRALFAARQRANDHAVVEFVSALDTVEAGVAEVERQLGQ